MSAIIDDFNVFDCTVYTPGIYRDQISRGMDTRVYVPRYRSKQPAPIPVSSIWGPFDFPFSIFKRLRKDHRHSILIPLEQQTFGTSPLSLALVPLLLFFCRLGKIKIVLNLQGAIPLSNFGKSFSHLKPGSRVPGFIAKLFVMTVYKFIFSLSNEIQVFSRVFAKTVLEYGNYSEKLHLVSVPIEQKRMTDSAGYFLAFGHIVPRKGLDYLVDAWSVMGERLIIAGRTDKDPTYAKTILDMAEKNPHIRTLENLPADVAEKLIASSKAMIFPYVYCDSISGPLCTALGYDKPIIASDIGIFKDVKGAYLCKPADPQSIREAVWNFLSDRFDRKKAYIDVAPAG